MYVFGPVGNSFPDRLNTGAASARPSDRITTACLSNREHFSPCPLRILGDRMNAQYVLLVVLVLARRVTRITLWPPSIEFAPTVEFRYITPSDPAAKNEAIRGPITG